jgi:hypothetical protein
MSLTGDHSRPLNPRELHIGQVVFVNSIDFSQVEITDGAGAGDRPWTNAGIGVDSMHLTPRYYANPPAALLVHELTHVWQGQNLGLTGWGYKLDSLVEQGLSYVGFPSPYEYDEDILGAIGFGMFNAEAQAQIVEDWYTGGMRTSDPRYPYIEWCIRKRFPIYVNSIWAPPKV